MVGSAMSLTEHLVQLDPRALQDATTHPFLTAAATSSLEPSELKAWLGQDRLYALSYINFISTLLSRVPTPTHAKREESLQWRLADLYIDSLINIRREIRLFEETASKEGWLDEICSVQPSRQTRAYQDLFSGAASPHKPAIVGLAVLWATEDSYLRSWTFARSCLKTRGSAGGTEKGGDVMQRVFIPNWSSDEFQEFVQRIGALLDEYARSEAVNDEAIAECEIAYRQVLWAEKEFWPDVVHS